MASIGVVGMGWVGSSVAMATLQRGVGKELLLNDVRPGIAEGEAMDLEHGSMFYRADATVRSVDLDEIVERTDAVVTTTPWRSSWEPPCAGIAASWWWSRIRSTCSPRFWRMLRGCRRPG